MSNTSIDEGREMMEKLLEELDNYLGITDSREYSDDTRDRYERVGPGQHPLHDAVVAVQDSCYDGEPLPYPHNRVWGWFLNHTRSKQHSRQRDKGIERHGYALYEWVQRVTQQSPRKGGKPRVKKWQHLWDLIQAEGATTGIGTDQKIANKHNKLCAAKIKSGKCKRIDAKKVAQIRDWR